VGVAAAEVEEPGGSFVALHRPQAVARVALESGAAIIVDVRSKQAYDESHIPGAINILLGEFETNINGIALEKDQWIITYCT